ncbi:MAG: peptide-methionine (S)-S-oxide reductase MsrA [Bacteroidota bacterium]
MKNENLQIATLGGGCFWCTEAVFERLEGVHQVISGYAGGHVVNPTYEEVCAKTTGHAEVTQVHFDAEVISYEELLEIFWASHDPTTKDRQGNDRGPQYRSVIYYHDLAQKNAAELSVEQVATTMYQDPIVTEIEALDVFYPAEAYHQDFYRLNPNYGYCRVIIDPKVAKVRAKYADRLKKEYRV